MKRCELERIQENLQSNSEILQRIEGNFSTSPMTLIVAPYPSKQGQGLLHPEENAERRLWSQRESLAGEETEPRVGTQS